MNGRGERIADFIDEDGSILAVDRFSDGSVSIRITDADDEWQWVAMSAAEFERFAGEIAFALDHESGDKE